MDYKDLNIDLINTPFDFSTVDTVDEFVKQNFLEINNIRPNISENSRPVDGNKTEEMNFMEESDRAKLYALRSSKLPDTFIRRISEVSNNLGDSSSISNIMSITRSENSFTTNEINNINESNEDTLSPSSDSSSKRKKTDDGDSNNINEDEDEMVLYKGRKILRSERLKQMRESQRKLRKARANEVNTLKSENDKLKEEIAMLKNDNSMFLSAIGKEMPDYSIGRLLQHVPPMKLSTTSVDFTTFVSAYKDQDIDISRLYYNDMFFLESYINNILNCVMSKWRVNITYNLNPYCKSFIYMPIYGYSLYGKYIREVEQCIKSRSIPSDWLKNDDKLPTNALSINGLIETMLNFKDLNKISFEVLIAVLVRYNFATAAGPTIYKNDLDKALERSIYTSADAQYLTHNIASCDGTSNVM